MSIFIMRIKIKIKLIYIKLNNFDAIELMKKKNWYYEYRRESIIKKTKLFKKLVIEYEEKSLELAPEIDGRIICIS